MFDLYLRTVKMYVRRFLKSEKTTSNFKSLGRLLDHKHLAVVCMRYTLHPRGRDCFIPSKFENLVRF